MKGDFTRSTFESSKHYTRVRMQQGRVPLDADWNEAQDIGHHLSRLARTDVIGINGFPEDNAGFNLRVQNGELFIDAGRGYVNGLVVENETAVAIDKQPDLPVAAQAGISGYRIPNEAGTYVAYLDVWERHITALEDDTIREVALGGPDTATRVQTIWQVKLEMLSDVDADSLSSCDMLRSSWQPAAAFGSGGRLQCRAEPDPTASDRPCLVPATAGFRRLENQLYRVEIHQAGQAGEATFKWSRDNASIVSKWTGPTGPSTDTLTVAAAGRDSVLNFQPNSWVELSDHTRELTGAPGKLVQLNQIDDLQLRINEPVSFSDFPRTPKVRKWDHQETVARPLVEGAIQLVENDWIQLEDGVEIRFDSLSAGSSVYRTGDYWIIPARTVGRQVLWTRDDAGDPLFSDPQGIHHQYCILGLLNYGAAGWQQSQDCRQLFPPLNDLPLSGEGCGEITVNPSDDIQAIISRIPAGGSTKLCFHPGQWDIASTITVANKGNLIISGAGFGSRILGQSIDSCFTFKSCKSVTIQDIQIEGGNAGIIGDGLLGALSFVDCEGVTLERVFVSCSSFVNRRVSAIKVWTSVKKQLLTEVSVRNCHIQVGHQQVGLLVVNGGRVTVQDNRVETPNKALDLSIIVDRNSTPELLSAIGRSFIHQIAVEFFDSDEAITKILEDTDFGLGDAVWLIPDEPVNALGQHRIVAQPNGWGGLPFVFSTDSRLSNKIWSAIFSENPIQRPGEPDLDRRTIKIRLKQLRSRLSLWLFDRTRTDISIPLKPIEIALDEIHQETIRRNSVETGGQGIVLGAIALPALVQTNP